MSPTHAQVVVGAGLADLIARELQRAGVRKRSALQSFTRWFGPAAGRPRAYLTKSGPTTRGLAAATSDTCPRESGRQLATPARRRWDGSIGPARKPPASAWVPWTERPAPARGWPPKSPTHSVHIRQRQRPNDLLHLCPRTTDHAAHFMRAAGAASSLIRAVATVRRHDDPARWFAAAHAVMRSTTYCVAVTDGPDGPTARTMQPFPPDDDLVVHLGTAPASRKAKQIEATGRALLIYQRNRDRACVIAHCRARILDDHQSRHRHFMRMWRAFWPAGPDDNFVVIRCEPYALEIWDARRGITPPPFGLRSARLTKAPDGTWQPEMPASR